MNVPATTSWPTCPRCSHRRETACPICGTAGNDLPVADYAGPDEPPAEAPGEAPGEASAESPAWLLLCPQCDEVFTPQFYRSCSSCGHDFGEGLELPQVDAVAWSPRVLIAIVALILCGLGLMLYFGMLLR